MKRLLSIYLSLVLALSLFVSGALAESDIEPYVPEYNLELFGEPDAAQTVYTLTDDAIDVAMNEEATAATVEIVDISTTNSYQATIGHEFQVAAPCNWEGGIRFSSMGLNKSGVVAANYQGFHQDANYIYYKVVPTSIGETQLTLTLTDGTSYRLNVTVVDGTAPTDNKLLYPLKSNAVSRNLTRIESQALANSALTMLYLPATVKYIAEDALEGSKVTTIYAVAGSYAWNWALAHGFVAESGTAAQIPYLWISDATWIKGLSNSVSFFCDTHRTGDKQDVTLYLGNHNAKLNTMMDDGMKGDAIAGDGIYTYTTAMENAEAETVEFYAMVDGVRTNTAVVTVYESEEDDYDAHVSSGLITYQGENEVMQYIDNEVLLFAADGATYQDIEAVARSIHGTIADSSDIIGYYQIVLSEVPTVEDYNDLLVTLNQNPMIEDAFPNLYCESENLSNDSIITPFEINDYSDNWNEGYPEGKNKGLETIYARQAWRLIEQYVKSPAKVTVGVIDGAFDMSHDDLTFNGCWGHMKWGHPVTEKTAEYASNAKTKEEYNAWSHGTHVAGIISAIRGNGKGIAGVAGSSDLYGISLLNSKGTSSYSMNILYDGIEKLFCANSSKRTVINYSLSRLEWGDDTWAGRKAREKMVKFLTKWLNQGYDFVIVAAAGNADEHINAKKVSIFNAIEDDTIKDRIIVVCEASNYNDKGTFSFAVPENGNDFCWGSRIDVAAPGALIYSTVPKCKWNLSPNSGYEEKNGTSMAAPHVAGIAALMWSANRNMTGAEIKQYIVETADTPLREWDGDKCVLSLDHDGNSHKMVNAARAVARALNVGYQFGGICGKSTSGKELTWVFDGEHTITISGSGAMRDFESQQEQPWHRYKVDVTKVVIDDGVTSIGEHAFEQFEFLKSVKIGMDVTNIGGSAFLFCKRLETISDIPDDISIGDLAFASTALTEIHFVGKPPRVIAEADKKGEYEEDLASFSNGEELDTEVIVLDYPDAVKDRWVLDKYGLWNGYHVNVKFKVRFDVNGGDSIDIEEIAVKAGDAPKKLPVAERKGYSFVEWNMAADGSGDTFAADTIVSRDIIVYAIWDKCQLPSRFPVLSYGGHKYQVSDYTARFADAAAKCTSVSGHLCVIDDSSENNALFDYLVSCGVGAAMIGLYDANGSNGTWNTWVTGQPVTYSNWGYNQPDWGGQTICVLETSDNSNYGWYAGQWDNGWNGDYYFICEWE